LADENAHKQRHNLLKVYPSNEQRVGLRQRQKNNNIQTPYFLHLQEGHLACKMPTTSILQAGCPSCRRINGVGALKGTKEEITEKPSSVRNLEINPRVHEIRPVSTLDYGREDS